MRRPDQSAGRPRPHRGRERFASAVTAALVSHDSIEIRREEVVSLPAGGITIVATGPLTATRSPLTSPANGSERLYFYDSISPIVDADSIDMSVVFRASRYGKSIDSSGDY